MEGRGVFKDDGPGELSIDIAEAKSLCMRINHREKTRIESFWNHCMIEQ